MFSKLGRIIVVLVLLCFPLIVCSQTRGKNQAYSGSVRVFVYDDPNLFVHPESPLTKGMKSETKFKLYSEGRLITLDNNIDWSEYANRQVSVQGREVVQKDGTKLLKVYNDSITVLDESPYAAPTSTIIVPPQTRGTLKVISVVVTVQQPGGPGELEPFMTPDQALAPVFSNPMSARNFFDLASGGLLKVAGIQNPIVGDAVFVTITSSITNCDVQSTGDWLPVIDDQMRLQGIEPNNYNATIIIYNDLPGCTTQSTATMGQIGLLNARQWIVTNKTTMVGSYGNETASHELGHVLGLSHSNAYRCTDSNNIPGSCTIVEYGDQSCFMGDEYMLPNVYQRRRLGWHDIAFKQLTFSGRYNVYSPSLFGQVAAKRLMSCQFCFVPLTGTPYPASEYLEARRDFLPYDNFQIRGELLYPYRQGVKLIIGRDDMTNINARPYLVDTTPLDSSTYNAPLVLQSYSVNGVGVTHTAVTSMVNGSVIFLSLPPGTP